MIMLKYLLAFSFLAAPAVAQSRQFDVSVGYNYQNSDQGQGVRTNLNGWYGAAQLDFTQMLALTIEVDNYYGALNGEGEQQQNFVIGPQVTFGSENAKLNPYTYIQGGDQRSSSSSSVEHAFNLQTGGGVQWKLRDNFALQVTPFEYSLVNASSGLTHSFGSKIGISWTVWKQKR
jgi:outer membrane protein with beta-barrel domain